MDKAQSQQQAEPSFIGLPEGSASSQAVGLELGKEGGAKQILMAWDVIKNIFCNSH